MTIDTALAERVDELARQYAATRSWTIGWLLRAALDRAGPSPTMPGAAVPVPHPAAAPSQTEAAN